MTRCDPPIRTYTPTWPSSNAHSNAPLLGHADRCLLDVGTGNGVAVVAVPAVDAGGALCATTTMTSRRTRPRRSSITCASTRLPDTHSHWCLRPSAGY